MKLAFVKPSQLTGAKYNPAVRTEAKNLKELLKSVELHGILSPLMADSDYNLIDGHRRLTCAKLLKMKSVPVVISDSKKLTRDEAFENINRTQRKLSNSDMIYIYVNGGNVPQRAKDNISEMEDILGRKALKKLGNANMSFFILKQAKVISRYCGKEDGDNYFIGKTIMWLFNNRQSYVARKAMEDGVGVVSLKNAIIGNRPLKRNWN